LLFTGGPKQRYDRVVFVAVGIARSSPEREIAVIYTSCFGSTYSWNIRTRKL